MKNQRITTDDLEYLIFVLNGSPLVAASGDPDFNDEIEKRDKILRKMEQIWLNRTWRKGLPRIVPNFIADQFPDQIPEEYLKSF
tara:strand:+ start:1152 stop:1403 length:252 start_codon:yes stop_codon:yes gene_type:complete